MPIPLPIRSKNPNRAEWQNLRPSAADLDALFPAGQESNIGLLLGQPSNNLVDADLDILEANKKGGKGGGEKEEKESAATRLVQLATEAGVVLFHSAEQVAYTVVPCGKHK